MPFPSPRRLASNIANLLLLLLRPCQMCFRPNGDSARSHKMHRTQPRLTNTFPTVPDAGVNKPWIPTTRAPTVEHCSPNRARRSSTYPQQLTGSNTDYDCCRRLALNFNTMKAVAAPGWRVQPRTLVLHRTMVVLPLGLFVRVFRSTAGRIMAYGELGRNVQAWGRLYS